MHGRNVTPGFRRGRTRSQRVRRGGRWDFAADHGGAERSPSALHRSARHVGPAGPTLIESAAYVTVHFSGGSASVELNGNAVSYDSVDFFDVIVDDQPPFVLPLARGAAWYDLAAAAEAGGTPLGPGDHTITLVKRTEAMVGTTQVLGFRFGSPSMPAAVAPPVHRIEIIGDSLACGFGIEGDAPDAEACSDNGVGRPGYGQGVEDAYKSVGVRVLTFADGLTFPGTACGVHPNIAAQRAGGERWAAFIRSAMGW